jgi:hypothetical protein
MATPAPLKLQTLRVASVKPFVVGSARYRLPDGSIMRT